MPGKHVHFSAIPCYYANTPSPSFSTSTLQSSIGPVTPPDLNYIPLPLQTMTMLHPCLTANSGQVKYDLSLPPSHVRGTAPRPILPDVPATEPPSKTMLITHALLPWTITVVPRSPFGVFVTVRDVFETLYSSFRTPVTAEQYYQLLSAAEQNAVSIAFHSRCSWDGGEDMKKGLKRIDFLKMQTNFRGLAGAKKGTGRWILEIS